MPEVFYNILTTLGLNGLANAQATQTPLPLIQFAVGDGNGSYYEPVVGQVSLVNEVWRGNINRVYVSPNNASWIVVEVMIPAADGGFDIREAGVFDGSGNLIAVGKYPLTNKPALGSGSEKDLYVRMILEVTNAANVDQTIDPSLIMATKEYVDSRDWRESVRAATTVPIADLLAAAPDTLDGVALAVNNRVLVKNQAAAAQNGIYQVDTVGTGVNGSWSRTADFDSSLEVTANAKVSVEEGTVNLDSLWMLTTDAPITLGTTGLTFKRIFGQTGVAAGGYTKVTVDVEGHVVAGENPSTLDGYGISDAETPAGAQAKVDAAINTLLNAPPSALDTLNELAAALGDDPNFATTMATTLATKETPAGAQAKVNALLPSGSRLVFVQASAPLGWTKVAGMEGRGLRLVDGAGAGLAGTSDAFLPHSHTVGAHGHNLNLSLSGHTLSVAEMPSHSHLTDISHVSNRINSSNWNTYNPYYAPGSYSAPTGGGESHSHGFSGSIDAAAAFSTSNWAPKYVNSIVCAKD